MFFYPWPMDLPPSGWYPDPYGTPRLLRWWDGASWTQHTHPDPTASGAGPADGEAAAANSARTRDVASTTVGATAVQSVAGQPSADRLSRTKPPTGPRTAPQPALPSSPEVAATAVQSPVQPTAVQSLVQPTAVQPSVQPTAYQPAYQAAAHQPGPYQPGGFQPGGGAAVNDGGTHVLFVGDDNPWTLPGGLAPGGPGGPGGFGGAGGFGGPGGPGGPGNRFGYLEAQRRRRRRLMVAGLAAGIAVAVTVIAVIATTLGGSSSPAAAQRTPAPHKHKTAPPAATASPSPTASPTASAGSLLSDGQSGLSYTQLGQPWQGPACPGGLSNGTFTWTAGEYAIAGQVNGGSATWYGEACSGPLPVQFGYQGAASLQPTAAALANSFENAYYGGLDHTITPGISQPVSVSGRAGWEVTYQVSYTNAAAQGAAWTDEQAAVVVVDPGTGNEPSVFFTSVPGNLGENNVASLVSSLQYSPPLGVTNTPTDGTPSGVASDGTGGGNPGNGNGGGGDGRGNHP